EKCCQKSESEPSHIGHLPQGSPCYYGLYHSFHAVCNNLMASDDRGGRYMMGKPDGLVWLAILLLLMQGACESTLASRRGPHGTESGNTDKECFVRGKSGR